MYCSKSYLKMWIVSGIFHVTFWVRSWSWVSAAMGSETMGWGVWWEHTVVCLVVCCFLQGLLQLVLFICFHLFERDRQIFHALVCSTHAHNSLGWSWGWLRPGAQNFILLSSVGDRDPTTCALTCCLPRCATGSWNEKLSQDWTLVQWYGMLAS